MTDELKTLLTIFSILGFVLGYLAFQIWRG
jgi:hypothetical protein